MATPALATSFSLPLSSPGAITNGYGVAGGLSTLPTYKHLGVDWGGFTGKPVLAAANGVVVAAASGNASFGTYVVIEHTLPNLTKVYTLYAHLNSESVSVGQNVLMGATIGGMGATGAATGIHLHFEVSYVNKFTQSGMWGKGYDSPTEFLTSSQDTVNPVTFINAHPVSSVQTGSSIADVLWGLSSSETLYGGAGGDTISGNSGNDKLFGGSSSDFLYGGSSSDTLNGGTSQDYLFGGSSADTFDFDSASESKVGVTLRDNIGDFSTGSDKIDLTTIDASTALSGNQAFKYIGSQSFHGVAGELSMQSGVIRGDLNGDRVADFEIIVTGASTLASGDFLL